MAEKERKPLTEEQAKKIAVGATVAGVLLLIFLLVILIVQFVQIGVRNAEEADLEEQIEKYEDFIERDSTDLEYYQTQEALYRLALGRNWKSSSQN